MSKGMKYTFMSLVKPPKIKCQLKGTKLNQNENEANSTEFDQNR